MEKISFLDISIQIAKTNDEVVILNTLHRLEKIFPDSATETLEIILEENMENICKSIRQKTSYATSMLFYELLNGDFGYKVIKLLKETNKFIKC